jgi:hypothetical protein
MKETLGPGEVPSQINDLRDLTTDPPIADRQAH